MGGPHHTRKTEPAIPAEKSGAMQRFGIRPMCVYTCQYEELLKATQAVCKPFVHGAGLDR